MWWIGLALLVVLAPLSLAAQRGYFGFGRRAAVYANVPYDGRFTVVRIRYQQYRGWYADYPEMERNLTAMMDELTAVNTNTLSSNVYDFDDPELMQYPIAYLSEPGYWIPTAAESAGLREYIDRGGFLIVDDFHYLNEWVVFESAIRRSLPDAVIHRLDVTHPVFNTFFEIKSLDVPYPGRLGERGLMGEFFGIYEDNDPEKRLSVVINYNMDIGDYMEWSFTNPYAMMPTNEAFKFAINYIVYGLTR
jgi:hypothetical protein